MWHRRYKCIGSAVKSVRTRLDIAGRAGCGETPDEPMLNVPPAVRVKANPLMKFAPQTSVPPLVTVKAAPPGIKLRG